MLTKIISPILTIRFFSRPTCSLCIDAKEILYPLVDENFDSSLIKVEEIDIDQPQNKEYYDLYKNDVPVCMVDKKLIFKHRLLDEDKFIFDIDNLFKQKQNQQQTNKQNK
ncbi:hypothetical protein PPL_09651 [Heterostelium album PN500]|uniref:Glutaredoxin-like protein n=1 Tax=Heterostelium pallidum (strain ATCC 26659 / Pp 5 / PN500) TaxID=670386 RepID=D3BNY0_HETP5|nr:hypothetical protein PPL_09651 [Heterostelium album PN500]EFA76899.1 hypothetical protein PPL_09651 [Heterostelium album PN500]|eukprot:XP_020429031.1 hypothetical protein PPL_09651 [Heterostelium album PN500]